MVGAGYPVHLHVFGKISCTIDQHLRERALVPVLVAVGDEERVLREFRSPSNDHSNQTAQAKSVDHQISQK